MYIQCTFTCTCTCTSILFNVHVLQFNVNKIVYIYIVHIHIFVLLYTLHSVQFDGTYVVSGAYDFLVKVWDPIEGTCQHTLQGHTNRVYSLLVRYTHI